MAENARLPWMQLQRFTFMEWKLFWEGSLNRSDIEEAFKISTPQASVDLRNYRELHSNNIEYNSTLKTFVPTIKYQSKYATPSADRLLLRFRAWLTGIVAREDLWFKQMPDIDMVPDIARHVDARCLRQVLDAIKHRSAIDVHYQSLTGSRWRTIAPHALAFDGHRWHVRALACDHHDFRDFVLSRISDFKTANPVLYDAGDDIEWNTKTSLILVPHPDLEEAQSRAVELDYSMDNGRRTIEVRLSMAYYFIKRMNLDIPELPATRVQIFLKNRLQVETEIEAARTESIQRAKLKRQS